MKHVVNIAFDFDDDKIISSLEESCEEDVKKDIRQCIIDKVFAKSDWGRRAHADPETDPIQEWVKNYIKEIIAEYKDEIVAQAGKELAQSMWKSKKWQEQLFEEVTKHE